MPIASDKPTLAPARVFFVLYGAGALGMAVADSCFGPAVAAQTSWGMAPGWLLEIAPFDAMVAYLCLRAVLAPAGSPLVPVLASALALLSALVGSHNLAAYWSSGLAAHLQGAAVHGFALIAALAVWRRGR